MTDVESLSAAKAGDAAAFRALSEPYRRELTVHCYRMLGSFADAEDLLQETFVRAWKGLAGFEARSSLRNWLYKIATHACLDALDKRKTRVLDSGLAEGVPGAPASDAAWLEPIPDDYCVASERGPEARYTDRESIALAFLALAQALPARQRAVLILRDVLGFSAQATADVLDMTVAAANSALQRARETMEQKRAGAVHRELSLDDADPEARGILREFVRAWEAGDAAGVVACLKHDGVFSMPPVPLWFRKGEPLRQFLESQVFSGGAFRVLETRANGCPALAVYQLRGEAYLPASLDVLEIDSSGIAEVVAFLAIDPALSFARFGLPESLPLETGGHSPA